MATELPEAGYEDLRDYIETNWIYVSIEDDTGTEIFRISNSDSRVSWTHTDGSQTLVLEINLTGGDSEITLPQSINATSLYKVSSSGNIMSRDVFDSVVTFETTADTLTAEHKIEVPEVV